MEKKLAEVMNFLKAEIEDLLYNENSEWNLSHNRWQILYNNGMMSDYSIYSDPIE